MKLAILYRLMSGSAAQFLHQGFVPILVTDWPMISLDFWVAPHLCCLNMRSLVGQPALGWGEAPSFGGPGVPCQDRLQQVSAQIPPVSKEVEIWAVSSPFSDIFCWLRVLQSWERSEFAIEHYWTLTVFKNWVIFPWVMLVDQRVSKTTRGYNSITNKIQMKRDVAG